MYKFDFKPYKNIAIFPHVNPDGDAIGSAVGMYLFLKKIGKQAVIVIDDVVEHGIRFLLDYAEIIGPKEAKTRSKDWDLCISVDCGDKSRLATREVFTESKPLLNIDHHGTNDNFGDFNIVDPSAPATCEIIYLMIKNLGVDVDKEIGEALYTGIVTDTGRFMYNNVTPMTFRVASEILDLGIDKAKIMFHLFQNERREVIAITNEVMSKVEYYSNGRIAISYVDNEMLQKTGSIMADTSEIVNKVRNIEGVEISVLLKDYGTAKNPLTKVSLRALTMHNLMPIAERYSGGGHRGAAGFSVSKDIEGTKIDILKTFKEMGY